MADLRAHVTFLLYLWPFVVTLVVVLLLKIAIQAAVKSSWYKRAFAAFQDRWVILTKEMLHQSKQEPFASLSEGLKEVSGDVLEIGVGPGANFDYYPQGTSLIAVDQNPYVEEHFRQNLKRAGKSRLRLKAFVVASAENMSSKGQVGVADDSVAAVVFTKMLCSLSEDSIRKTIREVKRVLKPGGRCYFLEHVADHPGTPRYFLQRLVSATGLWPTLFNGCRCDREITPLLQQHHFKHLSFKRVSIDCFPRIMLESTNNKLVCLFQISIAYFASTFLYGHAEK